MFKYKNCIFNKKRIHILRCWFIFIAVLRLLCCTPFACLAICYSAYVLCVHGVWLLTRSKQILDKMTDKTWMTRIPTKQAKPLVPEHAYFFRLDITCCWKHDRQGYQKNRQKHLYQSMHIFSLRHNLLLNDDLFRLARDLSSLNSHDWITGEITWSSLGVALDFICLVRFIFRSST